MPTAQYITIGKTAEERLYMLTPRDESPVCKYYIP